MTKIRIDTEHAREVARRLMVEGEHMAEMGRELGGAISGLNTGAWDGQSRYRAEPMLNRVQPESRRVAEGLDTLGRKLLHVAETFEVEDNTAARALEGMGWVDFETSTDKETYVNKTAPTRASTAPMVDERPPWKRFLGDYTPLAFIPGFTPPAGGDTITVDDRIDAKFGYNVNIVDGNKTWQEHEVAAVDRATGNFPDSLAQLSEVRNIYRDSEHREKNYLGVWYPPTFQSKNDDSAYEEASIVLYDTDNMLPRQGGLEQRAEVVVFHELVHSAQFNKDGTTNDLTNSYLSEFGWSFDGEDWNYSGNPDAFPGAKDKWWGENAGYPESDRNGLEDMAEAITYYRYEPETLRKDSPKRYEWVKEHVFKGEEF